MRVLLWPVVTLWRLVAFVLQLTGRLVGLVVGLILLMVGVLLSLTGIGAVVGVPLASLGFLMIVRSVF